MEYILSILCNDLKYFLSDCISGPACDPECPNSARSQKETDGRLKLTQHLIYKGINYKDLRKVLRMGQKEGIGLNTKRRVKQREWQLNLSLDVTCDLAEEPTYE